MGILDDFYKFMSPGTMEETKPVSSIEEVDPKVMQQLYQQMLQDSDRVITPIEIEREPIESMTYEANIPKNEVPQFLIDSLTRLKNMTPEERKEADRRAEEAMTYERSRGPELIPEGADMSKYINIPVDDEEPQDFIVNEKIAEDFGNVNLGTQSAKQRELDDTISDKVLTESEIKDIKQAEKIIQDRENRLEKEKKSNNIITYDSGLRYDKNTDTYSSTDPKMNALLSVESSGKHTKKGKINVPGGDVEDLTKARGLTQLKPTSFSDLEGKGLYARNFDRSFTVSEIDNPETNYLIGEEYLNNLFKDFKRLGYGEDDAQDLGYIAYNQGYQAVVDWLAGKKSLKKEGQEYIRKINKELGIDRGVKDRKEYKKIK
jgi:hypothetical protein|tara:strand:- start:34 stop:1158 length:1125 start_codon:yes stop_codon:yes gene_type:complete